MSRHVHVRAARSDLAALELLAVRKGWAIYKNKWAYTCPSMEIKNRTLTLTISHTLSCNFFNMQLLQNHYSFIIRLSNHKKHLNFFSPTPNRQSTWNNITNKIKRLKAKLRRLELCIPVEQLHRQPHSPIYSWALRDAQRWWEVMLSREPMY